MRALVARAPGQASLETLPEPVPHPGEVIVRVRAALTCGTDFKLLRRGHPKFPFPITLGHEFAGDVYSVGEGAGFQLGERVTSAVSGPCGHCSHCRRQRENLCETAFDHIAWGGFATFVRIPSRVVRTGLHRLPGTLPYHEAALLDPLSSVLRGLSRLPAREPAKILITGSGPIAYLFAVLLGKRHPASEITVAGRRRERLETFAEIGFRTLVLRDGEHALSKAGSDWAIDTTGHFPLCEELVSSCHQGGVVLLFAGMAKGQSLAVAAQRLHYDEVDVIGSFHYTPRDSKEALRLLAAGEIPVSLIGTPFYPLEDYPRAFAEVTSGLSMKAVIVP